MPTMTDDKLLTNGERVSGNFVGIIQRDDVLQCAGGRPVDQQAARLGDKWHGLSEWSAACHDDTIRFLTD